MCCAVLLTFTYRSYPPPAHACPPSFNKNKRVAAFASAFACTASTAAFAAAPLHVPTCLPPPPRPADPPMDKKDLRQLLRDNCDAATKRYVENKLKLRYQVGCICGMGWYQVGCICGMGRYQLGCICGMEAVQQQRRQQQRHDGSHAQPCAATAACTKGCVRAWQQGAQPWQVCCSVRPLQRAASARSLQSLLLRARPGSACCQADRCVQPAPGFTARRAAQPDLLPGPSVLLACRTCPPMWTTTRCDQEEAACARPCTHTCAARCMLPPGLEAVPLWCARPHLAWCPACSSRFTTAGDVAAVERARWLPPYDGSRCGGGEHAVPAVPGWRVGFRATARPPEPSQLPALPVACRP